MDDEGNLSKRIKLDNDDTSDDIIILNDYPINNNNKINIGDEIKNNSPTTSNESKNNILKLSPKISKSSSSPDIIIDDDDIIEVASFLTNKSTEEKSLVLANINTNVNNLSPVSSKRTQLSKKEIYQQSIKNLKWNHQYCVTTDPNASNFFDDITSYKLKFRQEFKKFNKDIWTHMSKNLQVIIYFYYLYT